MISWLQSTIKRVSAFFNRWKKMVTDFFFSNQSQVPPLPEENSIQPTTTLQLKQNTLSSAFENLPDEMVVNIKENLSSKEIITLIGTSQRFYNLFFQPKRLLEKLLQAVLYGNKNRVEEIIKLDPHLLLERGKATDYSGRIIEGTAYQMALGAMDVGYHDGEEGMAQMIARYMSAQSGGDEEIKRQINQQFPEGYKERMGMNELNDKMYVEGVASSLLDRDKCPNVEEVIQRFDDYIRPKDVITTGMHFNFNLVIYALYYYDEHLKKCQVWKEKKEDYITYWRNFFGLIATYFTANFAQASCQGLYTIIEEGQHLERSLTFAYDKPHVYFPLNSNPKCRMGKEYAPDLAGGRAGSMPWAATAHLNLSKEWYEKIRMRFNQHIEEKLNINNECEDKAKLPRALSFTLQEIY